MKDSFRNNVNKLKEDIDESIDIVDYRTLLTADGFGHISQKVSSTYYMVGKGDFAPRYSTKFYVYERYIKLCTMAMALAAMDYLTQKDILSNNIKLYLKLQTRTP